MRARKRRPSVPIALTFAILFNFAVIVILFLYSDRQINALTERKIFSFRLLDTWNRFQGSTIRLLSSDGLEQSADEWSKVFEEFQEGFNEFNQSESFVSFSLRDPKLDSRMLNTEVQGKKVNAQVQETRILLEFYLESAPEEVKQTSLLQTLRYPVDTEEQVLFYEETSQLVNQIEILFTDFNGQMGAELRPMVDLMVSNINGQANEIRLISLIFSFSVIVITVVFIIYGQRSIRASEERFKHTVQFSPYPIALVDTSGKIEYVNSEFIGVFGYTLEDISTVDAFFEKAFPTEDSLRQIQGLWTHRPTDKKGVENYLLDIQCKDGELKHINFRLVDVEGKRRFIFCEDMTSRIQAERALVESNDALNTILETAPLPIFALDLEGRVNFLWNPAAEKLLGWTKEEVLGKTLPTLSPENQAEFQQFLGKVISGEVLEGVEAHRKKKNGSPIDYGIYSAPLHNASGNTIGNVSLLLDLTEIKRNKQEREDLISELEAKNLELERFTYTVSHDLKSPLITIKGFLGLLEEDIADNDIEQIQNDISKIKMAAEKMQNLLKELLELSRIGRQSNPPEEFSMTDLANEVVDTLEGVIRESGAEIRVLHDMPPVKGDRPRVCEVLQNLIENAIKYSSDGQRPFVEIGYRSEEPTPAYYVRDNGIGIEEKYQEKIFGLFEKLDERSEGTGVGLALVKRIIDIHRGRIWVESNDREPGTRFCFTLPQA